MAEQVETIPVVDVDVAEERKKPRLLALLFCDYANFTKDDKVNLVGIFDRIYVDPEQKLTPRFIMFVRAAEITEGFVNTVFAPNDTPAIQAITTIDSKVKFSEHLPRQVQSLISLQFGITIPGVYWFDISYEGKSLGGAALTIEYRPTEDKQGGTDTYT